MGSKTYILLTMGISLLVLTSTTRAQDEQWLQYHSEREAHRIVRDMGNFSRTDIESQGTPSISEIRQQRGFPRE